jgi:16S rRNA (guanine966-N2)-methyltransferase
MRVIAGTHRGRQLKGPTGREARPTTGRLRESLFSALTHCFHGSLAGLRVADVFAGTGALGIEALSRGAAEATFVENHPDMVRLLKENLAALGLADRAKIVRADATRLRKAAKAFEVIFLDPPYGQARHGTAIDSLRSAGWLGPETLVVAERERNDPPVWPGATEIRCLHQGKRFVHFLAFKA